MLKIISSKDTTNLQWLQDPSKINGEKIRREGSRHFRNKIREYLRDKVNKLHMNSKNKNNRHLHK
jgi:hypothetical protein